MEGVSFAIAAAESTDVTAPDRRSPRSLSPSTCLQRADAGRNPIPEIRAEHLAPRNRQDRCLTLVDRGRELVPVQHEKNVHRRMPNTFVPIHKRMVLNERVPEGRGLTRQIRI